METGVFLTVYKPIAGYKAVLIDHQEGPLQTGLTGYKNEVDAINEMIAWAFSEEIPFEYKDEDGDIHKWEPGDQHG